MESPTIHGPDPIDLEGRRGSRYWVHHPVGYTRHSLVEQRLSGYPVAVFQPAGRPAHQTPVVVGLQGMAAPYQWNAFLLPTLLDMGIACVLFDIPLAGERSLARNHLGDPISEVTALLEHSVALETAFVPWLMQTVARDFATVFHLIEERHDLGDARRALFGVSLGTLLSSYAFMRDGIGQRLLGTIGHAELPLFAHSYAPALTPWLCSLPLRKLARFLTLLTGRKAISARADFLVVLNELRAGGEHGQSANPMRFLNRVGRSRRVRFLVGADDPLVNPDDARTCAARFPDGACYVVPGLGHGGDGFVEHARYYVATQLGDWRW
jgi:hypothetical protein